VVEKAAELLAGTDDDDDEDEDDDADEDEDDVDKRLEKTKAEKAALVDATLKSSSAGAPSDAPIKTANPRPKRGVDLEDAVHRKSFSPMSSTVGMTDFSKVINTRHRSSSLPDLPSANLVQSQRSGAFINYSVLMESVKRATFASPGQVVFASKSTDNSDHSLWKSQFTGWLYKKGVINQVKKK